jgi:hypothetical protein
LEKRRQGLSHASICMKAFIEMVASDSSNEVSALPSTIVQRGRRVWPDARYVVVLLAPIPLPLRDRAVRPLVARLSTYTRPDWADVDQFKFREFIDTRTPYKFKSPQVDKLCDARVFYSGLVI